MFIDNRAFGYENGRLVPVSNPSSVTLDDLKCYEQEKATINSNIVNFMSGLPFGNMLLYGDRGTGKSSTIHAMLNRYWEDGLRLIELNKENMLDLPKIRQLIIENPLKFIIFIDDLSLNENDDKILLTTGAKELPAYAGIKNIEKRVVARVLPTISSIESCLSAGIASKHIVAMQGPFAPDLNLALLRQTKASYFVTKETGKAGGFDEKAEAAEMAGAVLVVIGRPDETGESVEAVEEMIKEYAGEQNSSREILCGICRG